MANPKRKKLHPRNLDAAAGEVAKGDEPALRMDGSVDASHTTADASQSTEDNPKLPPPIRPQWLAFGVSVVLFVAWLLFLVFVAYEVLS